MKIAGILAVLFLASCTGAGEAADPAWKPLFNGKDLSGWVPVGSAVWKVEDGVVVGGQDGDPKRSGVLEIFFSVA